MGGWSNRTSDTALPLSFQPPTLLTSRHPGHCPHRCLMSTHSGSACRFSWQDARSSRNALNWEPDEEGAGEGDERVHTPMGMDGACALRTIPAHDTRAVGHRLGRPRAASQPAPLPRSSQPAAMPASLVFSPSGLIPPHSHSPPSPIPTHHLAPPWSAGAASPLCRGRTARASGAVAPRALSSCHACKHRFGECQAAPWHAASISEQGGSGAPPSLPQQRRSPDAGNEVEEVGAIQPRLGRATAVLARSSDPCGQHHALHRRLGRASIRKVRRQLAGPALCMPMSGGEGGSARGAGDEGGGMLCGCLHSWLAPTLLHVIVSTSKTQGWGRHARESSGTPTHRCEHCPPRPPASPSTRTPGFGAGGRTTSAIICMAKLCQLAVTWRAWAVQQPRAQGVRQVTSVLMPPPSSRAPRTAASLPCCPRCSCPCRWKTRSRP